MHAMVYELTCVLDTVRALHCIALIPRRSWTLVTFFSRRSSPKKELFNHIITFSSRPRFRFLPKIDLNKQAKVHSISILRLSVNLARDVTCLLGNGYSEYYGSWSKKESQICCPFASTTRIYIKGAIPG